MAYRFGPFRVDPEREELFRGDEPVTLNRKAVQLLVALIERRGELVTKQELFETVWPQRGATMNNVSQHIFMLRQALDDPSGTHRYILTVPRAGYRFVAPVEHVGSESPNRVLARHYCANARELWQMRTQTSLESAIALYERAIEQDEQCAEAHSGLAVCRLLLGEYMFEPGQAMLRSAEADARRALELDERDAYAMVVLAIAARQLRYAWDEAEQHLLAALHADPQHVWAHFALIDQYAMRGNLAAARRALAQAESLHVRDEAFPRLPLLRGLLHYVSGAQSAAIAELELLVAHYPRYALARFILGKALLVNGEPDAAQVQVDEILRLGFDPLRPGQPNVRERAITLGVLIRAAAGDRNGAIAATREFEAEMKDRPVSGVCHAVCAIGCEEPDLALRYLQSAIANHDPLVGLLAVDPIFDPLRARKDWDSLLSGINLPVS